VDNSPIILDPRPDVINTEEQPPLLSGIVVDDGGIRRFIWPALRRWRQVVSDQAPPAAAAPPDMPVAVRHACGITQIDEAFARDMVDPWLIDKTYVEQSIAQGDAWVGRELDRCAPTGIPDTIAELEAWAAFRQERPTWEPRQPARPGTPAPASTPAMPPPPPEPIRGSSKVGRNAPCPCGSGLKYKKCCGSGS